MASNNNATAIVDIEARIKASEETIRKLRKELADMMAGAWEDSVHLLSTKTKVEGETATPTPVDDKKTRKEEYKKAASLFGTGSDIAGGIGDTLIGLVKTGVGIIQDVYNRIKSTAPLLQSVEQLFNLAMTLFFMPLGNKLATEMLPAVLDLVSDVTDMWDAFEGMSLGEMFGIAIEKGVSLLGDFFQDIGSALKNEGGLLGTIGSLITHLGEFIKDDLIGLIDFGVRLLDALFRTMPLIIALIGEFVTIHYTLMLAQIAATLLASVNPIAQVAGGIVGIGAIVALIAGSAASLHVGAKVAGMASGGHVDATPGGQLTLIAEGGEGETVVPDSKWDSVGKKTFNITINGLTMPELKEYIKEVVNDQTNENRLRGLY